MVGWLECIFNHRQTSQYMDGDKQTWSHIGNRLASYMYFLAYRTIKGKDTKKLGSDGNSLDGVSTLPCCFSSATAGGCWWRSGWVFQVGDVASLSVVVV